jgi:hypothetical protein
MHVRLGDDGRRQERKAEEQKAQHRFGIPSSVVDGMASNRMDEVVIIQNGVGPSTAGAYLGNNA